MVTIYCEEVSSRVSYTFELLFTYLLRIEYSLTSDQDLYNKAEGATMCYGADSVGSGVFFKASGLLFEEGISQQALEVGELGGHPALFEVGQPSAIEYDLFAAIFYMVTRYEEYLPHETDDHGRFLANQSIAFKNDFLESPVVDIWAIIIAQKLNEHYPNLEFGERNFQYINTIDIDNAYAYSGKGALRSAGGLAKSAIQLDKKQVQDRVGVMSGAAQDPYDTYDYMKKTALANGSVVKSFILLGDYGPFDKNLPHSSDKQIQAVELMAEFSEVGMHPSYDSEGKLDQIKEEQSRLSDILKRPVKLSRQHYLKVTLPDTYELLLACGIEEDHSMGYGEAVGFRAGTCTAFKFFNLKKNKSTNLMIHPFAVMDRTLNDYMKLGPAEAIQKVDKLADAVKRVDGTFISVWHNESLSNEREWEGWLPVYECLQSYSTTLT